MYGKKAKSTRLVAMTMVTAVGEVWLPALILHFFSDFPRGNLHLFSGRSNELEIRGTCWYEYQ